MTKAILLSALGPILIDGDDLHLRSIHILDGGEPMPAARDDDPSAPAPGSPVAEAVRQLSAYFSAGFTAFNVPLAPMATVRGEALRAAITGIPPGETLSYGAVAKAAGSSPRAIGQACARNPFPIVIPCHRVVGSGGAIGHYSAGRGTVTKTWLLDHERRGGLL
ncbi:methylated-DNA--[protein]-cysteine S-methyltransferase [Rhizorhabdus argentea]|uniref:methylated-DNA--[protein]-cysteine S-methyltransferase n=1 Tax=Rhizorhabdus argentea TaxID=1387174 RepID=UPI0030EC7072